jgi:hypothetical protein
MYGTNGKVFSSDMESTTEAISSKLDELGAGPADIGICGGACGGMKRSDMAGILQGHSHTGKIEIKPECHITPPSIKTLHRQEGFLDHGIFGRIFEEFPGRSIAIS